MNSERWRQIENIFHAALERDPQERSSFLAQACANVDPALRREVESLIAYHEGAGSFLNEPAVSEAARILHVNRLPEGLNAPSDDHFLARDVAPPDDACRPGAHEMLTRFEEQHINLLKECPTCGSCYDWSARVCNEDGAELALSLPVERTVDGKYRLDRLLSRGGMGAVYEAFDLRLSRKIAVKIIHNSFGGSLALRRFEREARAFARLNHPNIVNIYDYGAVGSACAYLVMELIRGSTLRAEIERRGVIHPAVVADWFSQMLDGIEAAHRAGVIHRDLKPENILLTAQGNAPARIKILDFGVAKIRQGEITESSSLTMPGTIMGTLCYMSPEQLMGGEVDERGDIFSIGVMAVEALTGCRPFKGRTQIELFSSILHTPFRLVSDTDEVKRLGEVLEKCLALDRSGRFSSAAELKRELVPAIRNLYECGQSSAEMHREGVKIRPNDLRPALPESAQNLILKALSFDKSNRPKDVRKFAEELEEGLSEAHQGSVKQRNTAKFEKETVYTPESPKNERFSRRLLVASVTSLLLVTVLAAFLWNKFSTNKSVVESVAVLPFNFKSANADAEYISSGITDSLIDELSRIPSMKKVIAHASVAHYRGQSVDPLVVGRELDVQAVLLGEITQQGNDFTVSAALVSTHDRRHIWGRTYNFRITDLLANQIEVSRNIVGSLQARLTDGAQPPTNKYPQNNAAYLLYLKGRDFWSNKDYYRAAEYFRQAIQKDPGFALAYSGLADSYSLMDDRPPNETMPQAKEAAIKALEIDNTLAEGHTSLALILFRYDWNWSAAEAEVKRAIDLNPNYAYAHHLYASYLLASERPDEALKRIQRARELDPLSVVVSRGLGTYFLFTRQYDKALGQYNKTLEIDPNAAVRPYLRLAYQEQGKFDEAFREAEKVFASRLSPEEMEQVRQAYAAAGYKGLLTTELKLLQERSKRQYASSAELARLCASLGQKDEAFEWLNKAYEARHDALVWLKVDPRYDNLRSDPRFLELLKRVGFNR